MPSELKPCPCGQVPERLYILEDKVKWNTVQAGCCGDWVLEFRANWLHHKDPECMELAIAEWNRAKRWCDDK